MLQFQFILTLLISGSANCDQVGLREQCLLDDNVKFDSLDCKNIQTDEDLTTYDSNWQEGIYPPMRMEKPSSAKSNKSASPPNQRRRSTSPPKSAGSSKKKSPSPSRKGKSRSPSSASRKSPAGELKSALRKGSGKEKSKKKTVVKSPDLTEDGLKIVDMSGQGMTVLPLSVLGAKDIGELCLASNNLRSLPPEIKRLLTLRKLDISKNGIRCTNPNDFTGIPMEICSITTLTELKISECNLPYVPPAIWQMTQLKVLDISRNKISNLIPDVGNLINLQKLNLQQTNITTLPPEIAYCQELEEILLWGNKIESLPETLPEMLKLRTLAVNYRSFCAQVDQFQESEELLRKGKLSSEHIPLVVFELATLEVLDLENTKINNIPDMSNISLRELYVCQNFLNKVPPSLFNLHHLTILDMSHNLLTLLPDDISRVTSLVILRLASNMIDRIPVKIKLLVNLEELNIAHNKVHYLPSALGGLKKLKALYVEKNNLTSLPDEICELENLETLDITENRITALPMKMHQLKNLASAHSFQRLSKHGLWLYKNPIVQPPPEIWKTERPEKIFDYLKKLAIIKTENLQRQKMLVFGESGSGKTSLIRGLVHRKSMMTEGIEDKTRALQQTPWKTDNNVEFMIHDFGGDPAYTMIYPLFADNKAMVLIVYDHSMYSTDTHYTAIGQWLDLLHTYMPGVVVKIVGTHLDNFEEYAVEDENGNLTQDLVLTPRSLSTARSTHSAKPSVRTASAQSYRSMTSSVNEDMSIDTPNRTSTPHSMSQSSAVIGQAKVVQELVKENVDRQILNQAAKIQQQLDNIEKEISSAESMKFSTSHINHLQSQQKRLVYLKNNPLRVMPNVSLVSSNEGMHGANALIERLELMVIDKDLFPHAQRSMPDKWNKLRISLKQHKTFFVSWETVEECGSSLDISGEELQEALIYLHGTGEILWFHQIPSLSALVFHKPRILNDILSALLRHDIENFLNFDHNKVFMSKGKFQPQDFEYAKELFLKNGQISRPLMNCLWFYEKLSYDQFNRLLDLVPLLSICYSIPEPSLPKGQLYSYPIIVLPWYNSDRADSDLDDYWNEALTLTTGPVTNSITFKLPLGIPCGLFENLACILQTHVLTRIDWRDAIFAKTESSFFKIQLKNDQINHVESWQENTLTLTTAIQLTILTKNNNLTGNLTLMKELCKEVLDLLEMTPGLVWKLEASENLWHSEALAPLFKSVHFAK